MALQLNNDLYTGGNERFDSSPHVQLYGQLMAKEQAKKEAFNEYIRNLNTSINTAGLRNVDRQGFDEMLTNWQKYGMENRDDIRNRRRGADIKFQTDFQKLQNYIQRSKGIEDQKKPLVSLLVDPDKRDRLGEEALSAIQSHDQSFMVKDKSGQWVENPAWRPLDYGSIAFNPKPFEQDKFFKGLDDIKPSQSSESEIKNTNDLTKSVTTTSIFTPADKDVIATRAVAEYGQNNSFKKFIDKLDPASYNDTFRQAYGKDIENKGDLAVAYTLKGKQQKIVTSKFEDDKEAIDARNFNQQKEMAAIQNEYATKRIKLADKLAQGRKEAGYDTWVNDYLDISEQGAMRGQPTLLEGADDVVFEVPIDPVMVKSLQVEKDKTPTKLYVSRKGTYYPIYKDEEGKIIKEKAVPLSRDQMVVTLGGKIVTKTQLGKEVKGGNKFQKIPLPKGKPKTIQQNGFTYEWDEKTGTYQ